MYRNNQWPSESIQYTAHDKAVYQGGYIYYLSQKYPYKYKLSQHLY